MTQVGRNETCPCLSGKKYKKCCLNDQEKILFFKENLQAQYIDSEFIYRSIEQQQTILTHYLNTMIPKLQKPIYWVCNQNLNSNMRTVGTDFFHVIIVNHVPIAREDYIDVAHEIGHLLLAESSFPGAKIKDNDTNKLYLGTILTNTVIDPLINSTLKSYGFDFYEYMEKAKRIQIPMIERYPEELELHLFDRHFLKCLFIEKILEWRLLNDQINPFEEIAKIKYPTLYKECKAFIEVIDEIGFDTASKVRYLLQLLLENNEMQNVIELI